MSAQFQEDSPELVGDVSCVPRQDIRGTLTNSPQEKVTYPEHAENWLGNGDVELALAPHLEELRRLAAEGSAGT